MRGATMTAPEAVAMQSEPNAVSVGSLDLFGLERYALQVAKALADAAAKHNNGTVTLPLEMVCAASQFVAGTIPNLRDVERINWLEDQTAGWAGRIIHYPPKQGLVYGPEVSIRMSIDVAMADEKRRDGDLPNSRINAE